MAIDSKTQHKLKKILEGTPFRQVVSKRANVHPNSVTNVLNGTDNATVELELLIYAQEIKAQKEEEEKMRSKARAIMKQL